MRVAFFVAAFPLVSETFILRQITGLLDLGHEVHIYAERCTAEFTHPTHAEVDAYDLRARVTYLDSEMPAASGYWCMPVWPIQGETWIPGAERPIANMQRILDAVPVISECLHEVPRLTIESLDPEQYGSQALSLEALYHLAMLRRDNRGYDVVHAHFGPVGKAYRFVRSLWGVPLVVTFHGYDFSAVPRLHGPRYYGELFRDADAVMAVSEYATGRLKALGCPQWKLSVLHTGVDVSDYPQRDCGASAAGTVRVLLIGRLTEKKGIEYALHAIANVHRYTRRIRCEIIGEGPMRPVLERLVIDLKLSNVVTLNGAADGAYVRQRLENSDIFLLPSVTAADGDEEGIPVSLMEAMASGLPVLSTRHSGIPELVTDGRCGFLVRERDVDALAERLLYLVEHPEVWPTLGREGRKIIEAHFNMNTLRQQLLSVYAQAIATYRRSTSVTEPSAAQEPMK